MYVCISPPSVCYCPWSRYVRRELRELTPTDLAKVMDATLVCYTLSTAEGQVLYGPNFVGLDTFQLWHHLNSGQRDADHFHQGVGFLAQHAKVRGTAKHQYALAWTAGIVCYSPVDVLLAR